MQVRLLVPASAAASFVATAYASEMAMKLARDVGEGGGVSTTMVAARVRVPVRGANLAAHSGG